MKRYGYVYIMTSRHNTVLYTGITSTLNDRVRKHKEDHYSNSFTARYHVHKLVYYERYGWIEEAIAREKQIKAGSRKKKIMLVDTLNPEWKELYPVKDTISQLLLP